MPLLHKIFRNFYQHNRAWVKIGDGCNQNCSFCIVPLVRGGIINRAPDEIISEVNNLIQGGYKEVVLTGVHVGQYKYNVMKSLSDLIKAVLDKTEITRLRVSSIEPQEVTPELIDMMSEYCDRICRHLHIPLQSGSDKILREMRRPYFSQKYLEIAEMAKNKISGIGDWGGCNCGVSGRSRHRF